MKKERSSNYELLRIISMVLIISYHLFQHSQNGALMFLPFSINKTALILLGSWGIVGVDCLVMLTAWFLLESTTFRFKKVVKVIVETTFYSLLGYISVSLYLGKGIDVKSIIKCLIGFAYDEYWFVTAYLVLIVLSPILNFVVRRMSPIVLRNTAIILFLVFVVWEFLLWASPVSTIGLFVAIYIITAYLKQSGSNIVSVYKYKLFLCSVVTVFLFSTLISFLPQAVFQSSLVKYVYITLLAKYSPVMLVTASSLFFIFKDFKIQSKFINWCGAHTFSAYLIHENNYIYPVLWGLGGVNITAFLDKRWFFVYVCIVVLVIYFVSLVLDAILAYIYGSIEKIVCGMINPLIKRIDSFMAVYYAVAPMNKR